MSRNIKNPVSGKKTKKPVKHAKSSGEESSDVVLPEIQRGDTFFVVGIGASAGGLGAIEQFFSNMPPDSGIAFIIIQHLYPNCKSLMVDILAKHTKMRVLQIEDRILIEPNCVYIKPPGKDAIVRNGNLYLTDQIASHNGTKHPIDSFFWSLAEEQAEKAIGIILSGAGNDGTLGARAIKDAGGIVLVQDEKLAEFSGMPASVIATGCADYVLPADKMAAELLRYVKHFCGSYSCGINTILHKDASHLEKIVMILKSRTGHNFAHYKYGTISRRIIRRMALNHIENLEDYVLYLRGHLDEVDSLFKDLMIGVTRFFRDAEVYKVLKEKIISRLFEYRQQDTPVRIWVIGCSTGEEAYSTAILLTEYIDSINQNLKIQIFATDVNGDALSFARAGIYPERIANEVSDERLKRFFKKTNHSFVIDKNIRGKVIFSNHNLIKDAPFSRIDLVCCRNLLIYLDPMLQKKVLPILHYVLNPGGFLILGKSETVGEFTNLFQTVDDDCRIYRKIEAVYGIRKEFDIQKTEGDVVYSQKHKGLQDYNKYSIGEVVKKILFENYAPACVVIDEKHEIVYFQGQTGKYLEPPVGEPRLNVLKMAREELRLELRTAINEVIRQKTTVIHKGVQINDISGSRIINLVIKPISEPEFLKGLMLVMFEDVAFPVNTDQTAMADHRIQELEQELVSVKRSLNDISEELESSNEKLKTSNEMLQIINEELKSANEELQTMNEELITTNTELQSKVEELSRLSDDVNNMLSSSEIGAIFMNKKLCITRYTHAVTKIIPLVETDIGRPIDHISTDMIYDDLVYDIKKVLKTAIPQEKEIRVGNKCWYLVRILPYKTSQHVYDGAIIAFINVTELKKTQEEIQLLQVLTKAISESKSFHDALFITLRKVCEVTGWVFGETWTPNSDGTFLERSTAWYSMVERLEEFHEESKRYTFPLGVGFPGQVWLSKQPLWVRDVTTEKNFLRKELAVKVGFKAGLAIPIITSHRQKKLTYTNDHTNSYDTSGEKEVVSVMVFFMYEARDEDERFVKLISAVASQLGVIVQQKRAEELLQKTYNELEIRIKESTADLLKTNVLLKEEISARKHREELLRKFSYAVEQNPCTVLITDVKGNIEYVNSKFTRLTGYKPEEVLGKNPRMLKSGKTTPEEYKHIWDTITSGREWCGKFYNKKKNGKFYWELVRIAPIKNTEGVITHFVAVKEDITKQIHLEDELKRTKEELKRQVEELQKKKH